VILTTVENVIHLDVTTDHCICDLDPRCGGVIMAHVDCPEHGTDTKPIVPIHSHKRRVFR
jgi:hypothetical protein